jgi:hypothetical protein
MKLVHSRTKALFSIKSSNITQSITQDIKKYEHFPHCGTWVIQTHNVVNIYQVLKTEMLNIPFKHYF